MSRLAEEYSARLRKKLKEREALLTEKVSGGGCRGKDVGVIAVEYAETVGQIKAFREAIEAVDETLKEFQEG